MQCQKCGTEELQGNRWICPACAYQPDEQELKEAAWIFKRLQYELKDAEAQFHEGAGLDLAHSLWRFGRTVSWYERGERKRRKDNGQD